MHGSSKLEITASNALPAALLEQAIEVCAGARVRFFRGTIKIQKLARSPQNAERKQVSFASVWVLVRSRHGYPILHRVEGAMSLIRVLGDGGNEAWMPDSPLRFSIDGEWYVAHWDDYQWWDFSSQVRVARTRPILDVVTWRIGHNHADSHLGPLAPT